MAVEKITKRDGRVVDFDQGKIELAMRKAFVATKVDVSEEKIHAIAEQVVAGVEERFKDESIPGVEDVQDLVERQIASAGYFEVAKAYILYRFQQKEKRQEEQAEAVAQAKAHQLMVTLRDGSAVPFDVNEITDLLVKCAGEYRSDIDVDAVVQDAIGNVYDGITTHELNLALVMSLKARIERDPVYSTVAARVLLNDLYRDVLGVNEFTPGFTATYREGF
ncbi:MAG: ATP cone domain-containing protein, partial [Patescibacteria group bacterium]